MAYNDYGAFVWRNGERMEAHEDAVLERLDGGSGGQAVFDHLAQGSGGDLYHAVLGDGECVWGCTRRRSRTFGIMRTAAGIWPTCFREKCVKELPKFCAGACFIPCRVYNKMSIDRLCADIQPHRMWKPPPRRMQSSFAARRRRNPLDRR